MFRNSIILTFLFLSGCQYMIDNSGTPRSEQHQRSSHNSSQEYDCESEYYTVVENMPVLLGGMSELRKKLVYPAPGSGIEGRVIVEFIVDENGKTQCHSIKQSLHEQFDAEAIRVVKEVRFKSGMQNGQPVPVQYSLPIFFKLQN